MAFVSADVIELTVPIMLREQECSQINVRLPTVGDLDKVDCSPILEAFGLSEFDLDNIDDLSVADIKVSMSLMLRCAGTLLDLLALITPFERPQLAQIAAKDLITALGVVFPLLLPSGPAEG